MGKKSTRSKQVIPGLANQLVMTWLREIAAQLKVDVRLEKGDFQSAGCRVDEQNIIFLKKTDSEAAQVETLLSEIAALNFEALEIQPALRDRLMHIKQHIGDEPSVAQEERP